MPDETDETDEDVRHGVDLRPNGSVHLWIEGKRTKLRNPRVREYRQLLDLWRDNSDLQADRSRVNMAWLMEAMLTREAEGDALVAQTVMSEEQVLEDRRRGREAERLAAAETLVWWGTAIKILAVEDRSDVPTEFDDLPSFLSVPNGINAVVTHWRSVPSQSGAR